ncbi:MAG: isoleucine--tRNA ligase [Erysipelotrichaceae bacterium]|nr:isoleucine--tRNA ligase [Erysipelotrichaceae bacterium]
MDFKDTLLMPNTAFEMRGNLPKKEPGYQARWEEMNLYQEMLKRNEDKTPFVLHDGPPYANGNLHCGTAMNRIIKDFIVKSKHMASYHVPFVPGWDTHGLPIENKMPALGYDRKKMSVADFRTRCHEYALTQVDIQRNTMKRLGTVADFENPYITLTKDFEANQVRSFAKMAMKGLIYQGLKPIYWSPERESAIADSEIVYFDKKDPTIYVAFDVQDGKGVLTDERFVIWTTTPWTIPANLAICLNPRFEYAVVNTEKGKLIVLSTMVDKLCDKFHLEQREIIKTYRGQELENITVKHPFYDRTSVIILGDHVTDEDGTGCVHTAPGHGMEDFIVGLKYGLPAYCPVDEKGCMMEEAGDFLQGQFVTDANKTVTNKLDELGNLLALEWVTHSYPHDERMKKPIIFRATVQWFASIEKIREELLKEIKNVKWENDFGEVRLYNMIRDRGDWCISRQRVWGVPIPIFYNEDKSPIMDEVVFEHVAKLFEEYGSNVWFDREAKDLLPEGYTNEKSPNGLFTKETDIMDVWFDSGSSHNILEQRGFSYPSDLYFEGSDQYRGWFNSSLIVGVATNGCSPYKSVLSHGYVLDGKGRKMSKSEGNVIDPIAIVDKFGADILRLWAANVDYKQDMRISDDLIKQATEQYRKIRNTFKFMLGNIDASDFNYESDYVKYEELESIDQYLKVRLAELVEAVKQAYAHYDFLDVTGLCTSFMTNELSSFYLDIAKDILYIEKKDSKRRRQVQSVIYDCVEALALLLAPILSFTTEEVYDHFTGKKAASVHLNDFPTTDVYANAEEVKALWSSVFAVRNDVLKALEVARTEKVIGKPLEAVVTLHVTDEYKGLLDTFTLQQLAQLFIVSKVVTTEEELPVFENSKCGVKVEKMNGHVCPRCWNVFESLEEDGVCTRCHNVLKD